MQKIIRTITYFSDSPSAETISELKRLQSIFTEKGFVVQTVRVSSDQKNFKELRQKTGDQDIRISIGNVDLAWFDENLEDYNNSQNINLNLNLTKTEIGLEHVEVLTKLTRCNAANTFNFTYLFNSVPTPYFPSAVYQENGFAVGLQPTDLSQDAAELKDWFGNMQTAWEEIAELMQNESNFLGIDSSIAPLFEGASSFIAILDKFGYEFERSFTTDVYTQVSSFIKTYNPKPYGLNGIMLPCLEDFELAKQYEDGRFSIERNIYVSLHSGLGIDTYPIGVDEEPQRIVEILKLLQALSNKYSKPLSCRFVSDGKAKIGEMTDFQNQYLKDVVIRSL